MRHRAFHTSRRSRGTVTTGLGRHATSFRKLNTALFHTHLILEFCQYFLNRPNSETGLRKVPVRKRRNLVAQSQGLLDSRSPGEVGQPSLIVPSLTGDRALNVEMKTDQVMLLRQASSKSLSASHRARAEVRTNPPAATVSGLQCGRSDF
jgi:hypothetical protein